MPSSSCPLPGNPVPGAVSNEFRFSEGRAVTGPRPRHVSFRDEGAGLVPAGNFHDRRRLWVNARTGSPRAILMIPAPPLDRLVLRPPQPRRLAMNFPTE